MFSKLEIKQILNAILDSGIEFDFVDDTKFDEEGFYTRGLKSLRLHITFPNES